MTEAKHDEGTALRTKIDAYNSILDQIGDLFGESLGPNYEKALEQDPDAFNTLRDSLSVDFRTEVTNQRDAAVTAFNALEAE